MKNINRINKKSQQEKPEKRDEVEGIRPGSDDEKWKAMQEKKERFEGETGKQTLVEEEMICADIPRSLNFTSKSESSILFDFIRQVFEGNRDNITIKDVDFQTPILARYIRICPVEWYIWP